MTRLVLITVATLAVVACAGRAAVHSPGDGMSEEVCAPESEAERSAAFVLALLTLDDSQSVQFAVDSLVRLRDQATPFLVCLLEDDSPLQVREPIMFLGEHPRRFESISHYTPRSVGHAVSLVVGDPPQGSGSCGSANRSSLSRCSAEWQAYLRERSR